MPVKPWGPMSWKTGKNSGLATVLENSSGMVLDASAPSVINDVIEACQQGDADAFRELFETYKDRVYSIALRYSGNPAAARPGGGPASARLSSVAQ